MIVYLIRHGQSAENILDLRRQVSMEEFRHAIRETVNAQLTEVGIQQAQHVAAQLASTGLTHLYASPYLRAQHTAQIIGAQAGLEVQTVDQLREIMPIVPPVLRRNRSRTFRTLYVRGLLHQIFPQQLTEGETLWTAQRRVVQVWSTLSAEWRLSSRVAIVAHRGFLWALLRHIQSRPGWRIVYRDLRNGGISQAQLV